MMMHGMMMHRSRGELAPPRHALLLFIAVNFVSLSRAGPLGPMPNVTSSELGLKEGSCALGDVVYMPGDEFPGSSPCEKCMCAAGDVKCSREVCEPRPGCKALHRPDHCCPTYQCECEQEGRVYGNGEKLVDPVDPCRVCYCQGGEVVCRRIACFVRDDCTPRLVPGRCCPEYDNCPLRGVTSLPGVSSSIPSMPTTENDAPPVPPKENIKQKITIKEITPVSEIPVITDVKIKEILPSIDVAEYSSSKSPLIAREATSEKNDKESDLKTESPSVVEVHLSSPVSSPESTQFITSENKDEDARPSKISFSTDDAIHRSIYPSNVPIVATMGVAAITSEPIPVATTKATIIEEEDTFDHNPAFPPLPDDLSVLRNHEDEIVPEPVVDTEHVAIHDTVLASASPSNDLEVKGIESLTTSTTKDLPDTTTTTTKETPRTTSEVTTLQPEITISTEAPNIKESPMINLRSAIPTEIMNSASIVPEEIASELDETTTIISDEIIQPTITTTEAPTIIQKTTDKPFTSTEVIASTTEAHTFFEEIKTTAEIKRNSEEFKMTSEEIRTTSEGIKTTSAEIGTSEGIRIPSEMFTQAPKIESTSARIAELDIETSTNEEEQTSSIPKTNVATEVTSPTELSSLPVETSDQNPPEVSEQVTSDKAISATIGPHVAISKIPSTSSEVITVSRAASSENTGFENVETTEFILTSYGSSETATDAVELIKISASPEKSSAIIKTDNGKKDNVLTDLINLVSDVASMSDHTDEPITIQQATTLNSISNSEELIPVNAGYKSKNKNFNQNSITEIPFKSKNPNAVSKQKVIEIEDDESEGVTDAPPPNDKVEPTTRRPIIDNVSDDNIIALNKTSKKDIEIITQSYVPTISRRPTKVVMKKTDEKAATDDSTPMPASVETTSDSNISNETPLTTSAETSASAEMSPASVPVESDAPSVEPELSSEPKPHTASDLNVMTEQTDTAQ